MLCISHAQQGSIVGFAAFDLTGPSVIYCATPFSPYLFWLNRFDSMVLKHLIAAHSRALFGSKKIRDLSKRLNFAPVMRNFVGMFLLYICTVLALRPERLGLQNLSQAMMVMGISEPQEEQKSGKMLGEPLEWSHWKTWKNWTVWTFLWYHRTSHVKKWWWHLWFHAFVLGWHAGNRLTELSCAEQAPKRRPTVPFRNWHRQGKPMVDMSAGKCSTNGFRWWVFPNLSAC